MKIINKEETAFHLTPKLGGLSLYHPDPIWLKLKTFPLIAFPIQQFKAAIPHSLCKDLDHFINLCGKWTWKRNSPYGWELSFGGGGNVISLLESICKGNLHYSISFYWPCKQVLKQFVLSYIFTLNRDLMWNAPLETRNNGFENQH